MRRRFIIDDVGDAHGIYAQFVAQDPGNGAGGVLNQPPGALLMADEEGHQFFERMGERIVADVVQQGGGEKYPYIGIFKLQRWVRLQQPQEKLFGQVVDAQGMLETGVSCPRVNEMYKAQLADVSQPLEVLRVDQGKQRSREVYVSPDRVTDGFAIIFK